VYAPLLLNCPPAAVVPLPAWLDEADPSALRL
jgi:hypothetical protein